MIFVQCHLILFFFYYRILPSICTNTSLFTKTKLNTFFISNTFLSNARLKLAKNQANAKQHPEAELLLFENYSHFSSTLSSKNNRTDSKKCTKNKYVCFNEIIWLMTIKMRLKMKNRWHRYDINRPCPRHNTNIQT